MTTDSTFDGAYLVEDVARLVHGVQSGDWVETGLSFVTGALSGLSFAIDPLGQTFAAALSWGIEHVPALKNQLMSLTGDRAALEAMARGWDRTADVLDQEADAVRQGIRRLGGQWSGQAGAAYRGHVEGRLTQLTFAAAASRAFAVVIKAFRVFLDVCYTFVRDLIAQTFGGLGSMLTTMFGSAGLGTPLAVAQFGKTVAAVGAKVAAILTKVAASVARLVSKYVNPLKKLISDALAKIARPAVTVPKRQFSASAKDQHRMLNDLWRANPNFLHASGDYAVNCWKAAVAFEMRQRGFNVTAKPTAAGEAGVSFSHLAKIWGGAPMLSVNSLDDVKNQMLQVGPGARGMIWISHEGTGTGHMTMVRVDHGGNFQFVDPQTGSHGSKISYPAPVTAHRVYDADNVPADSRIYFVRTDNTHFDPAAAAEYVVPAATKVK